MYKIKNLIIGKYFVQLGDHYYWGNTGDTFETFDDTKWVQRFYNLHDSAIVEVK